MPKRIQLSRKKGWRMPPDTEIVDRSTKWGNPFIIAKDPIENRPISAELIYRSPNAKQQKKQYTNLRNG